MNGWAFAVALMVTAASACGSETVGEVSVTDPSAVEVAAQLQSELEAAISTNALTASTVRSVRPVLKCVERLSPSSYKAHWGYTNTSVASVAIPVGFFNRFFPPPVNRGQPNVFLPGSQLDVVQVPFARNSLSAWILGSTIQLATASSKPCPASPGTGGAAGMGSGGRGGAAGQGGAAGGTAGAGSGGSGTGGAGQCPSTCDDHNPCTLDICNAATGFLCSNTPVIDGIQCSDGNACTIGDACRAGACQPGTPTVCVAADPCHAAGVCSPATGICSMPAASDGVACNDGDLCTTGDVCTSGVCRPGAPTVCVAADQCHTAGVCSPSTGACSMPPVSNGVSCTDGNACTTNDVCTNGICQAGTPKSCPAPDRCHTVGICDPGTGSCGNPAVTNGTSCADTNLCNGTETCQSGVCVGGSPLVCTNPSPCQVGSCNPVTGCAFANVADGSVCQSQGACGAGICQAGACVTTAQTCDDRNPCTADACGAGGACTHSPIANGSACGDGNACNGAETCQAGVCAPGAPVTCVASDQCHVPGACNPAAGACTNPAAVNGSSCSDGNTCTQNDVCTAGVCQAGPAVTCAASDQCHSAGTCDPSTGICLNAPLANGSSCSDGSACTVADTCQGGVCAPGNPVTCTASDQCHGAGACSPSTGVCSNPALANGSACSDGNACTQMDSCQLGGCVSGVAVSCTAPDPCHASACDGATGGCVTVVVADGTPCSDGDACSQGDSCQAGTCAAGTPKVCASSDGCHPGVCDPGTGTCSNPLACHLYGVGSIPGTATDGLAVTPTTLEDGVSNNLVGGLGSAIAYTGVGNLYLATPDRGPNNGLDSYTDRYYLIEISLGTGGTVSASLRGAATLNKAPGSRFTGLASAFDATNSPASLRLDPEGIRVSPAGTMFVSDEYGPFLYELGADGNRIRALTLPSKFLIDHPFTDGTLELPPGNTKGRQSNRGMEGLAISPDGSHLFGMMQSPLIQDGGLNAANSRVGTNVRILEYNLVTNATREYLYQMDSKSYGISEIVAVNDHQFLVLERDGNGGAAAAFKQFFMIDIASASDISGVAALPTTGTPAGVTPVSKKPFLNMLDSTYGLAGASFPEKVEGIAFGPDLPDGRHVAVVTNDSDFLATNNNNFYVFTIDPVALPGYQVQSATFSTACVIPSPVSCPASNECHLDGICRPDNGQCSERIVAPGSPSATQAAGDCHQNQCNASGQVVSVVDNGDVQSDANSCTADICSAGTPSNPPVPAGIGCSQGGGSRCNGSGACVQCLAPSDCPGVDGECSFRTCSPTGVCGIGFAPAGTPVARQSSGDCHENQCDGAGGVVAAIDNGDVPVDASTCTTDICTAGTPSNPPAPANTTCQAGVCDGAGICVGCTVAAQCPGSDTFCAARACTAGACGFTFTVAGTALPTQIVGDCKTQVCDGAGAVAASTDSGDLPVDGNVCTADTCTGGIASNPSLAYGTTCGTNLICNAGTCTDFTFRVVRIGDGSAALSAAATAVFVEERKVADGSLVQTIPMPTAVSGSNRMFTDSGTATSDGHLSRSVNGQYLTLAGYDAAVGTTGITGAASATLNRIVGRIDATGSVDTSTRFNSAFSGNNIRSAVSVDGSAFWAGGAGGAVAGAWYIPLGATGGTQLTSANTRVLGIFNGQLYGSSSATPLLGVYTIGSGIPQSGAQPTVLLPGETTSSSSAFVLLDLDPGVSGVDTLYMADDGSVVGNTGGGLQKWTFNGTTWTRVRTFAASAGVAGFRGVAAQASGSSVLVIASSADVTLNRIVVFTDDGSTSPVLSSTGTTIATAPANMIFRGVAFSPHN